MSVMKCVFQLHNSLHIFPQRIHTYQWYKIITICRHYNQVIKYVSVKHNAIKYLLIIKQFFQLALIQTNFVIDSLKKVYPDKEFTIGKYLLFLPILLIL